MAKKYEEMNEAEKLIIDYLQVYALERNNSKVQHEKNPVEIVLEEMALKLNLLD